MDDQTRRFRSLDGGMAMDSRYLATVRRATLMFCSASIVAMRLSLNGFLGFSSAVSFLISARMAVLETSPPLLVDTWLARPGFDPTTRPAAMAVAVVLGTVTMVLMVLLERWREDRVHGGL